MKHQDIIRKLKQDIAERKFPDGKLPSEAALCRRFAAARETVRRALRELVRQDLVATRNPLLPGTRVVDHDLPLAYCLPGLRPRVVLSRGVLDLLREDEVRAVLAHEDAHVVQRHDLVVLPFAAFGTSSTSSGAGAPAVGGGRRTR